MTTVSTREPGTDPPTTLPDRVLSLATFLRECHHAVRRTEWVAATVSRVAPVAAGLRLDLGEAEARTPAEAAALRAFIPTELIRTLRDTEGVVLDAALLQGARIVVQVTVGIHKAYGFEARVTAIDPRIVAKIIDRQDALVRERLRAEGLWDAQGRLPPPRIVRRIMVIAPRGADGLGDVEPGLRRLEAAGVLDLVITHAAFSGVDAIGGLIAALGRADDQRSCHGLDLVWLIRGGGVASEFRPFCDPELLRAVARLRIPVWTGLGHASTQPLIQEVAARAFTTPTAALAGLHDCLRAELSAARRAEVEVRSAARAVLAEARPLLAARVEAGTHAARAAVAARRAEIARAAHRGEAALADVRFELRHRRAELDRLAREFSGALRELPATQRGLLAASAHEARGRLREVLRGDTLELGRVRGTNAALAYVERQRTELDRYELQAVCALQRLAGTARAALSHLAEGAAALDPEALPGPGWCLALDDDGAPLATAAALRAQGRAHLIFRDGPVAVRVEDTTHPGDHSKPSPTAADMTL
ncbi:MULTISPECIES: exodeoxyribonuclease VII large subunit [unclassified Methylobacterium]|jgi:exodeoxyribonuclease VII large subunit|uniref:exodeoxyribonuclease VII large subunit n=1 Tax=unclassified Methylobacterium TaxID=2615210 RepID=UPI0013536AAD|nr:exodeoxyribonuclease VII large subunit [Methylobacterium sp. 2A]MWV23510.1 hypothetical protein [Methylobacterium sp. 2A]